MNPRSPGHSTSGYPSKRARHSPSDSTSPNSTAHSLIEPPLATGELEAPVTSGKSGQSSSFRNVSACNRCRLRKNRCDQKLPSCASCEKANVKCVGYDPITKREIPRSYVFYLESRVSYLENLLQSNGIEYAPSDALSLPTRPDSEPTVVKTPIEESPRYNGHQSPNALVRPGHDPKEQARNKKRDESEKLNKLVSNIGMVSVQGASDPRYLGSTSGISFARVVFAAVKSSVSGANSEKGGVRPSKPLSAKAAGTGGTSMRDSFFGLQTKPTIKQAPFPDKELGMRLVTIFFEYSNPQIPVLHRGEFMKMFEEVYADPNRPKTPRELYMLNIVFAIGSGIFLGEADEDKDASKSGEGFSKPKSPTLNRGRSTKTQCQPEEYHASAIVHLEACLSSSQLSDRSDGFGGGLEELQAVLLLAGFALLRPVAPGLWYIVGVAVRLAVDLGLHYEDGKDLDIGLEDPSSDAKSDDSEDSKSRRASLARERGRREWIRDLRRRLWWCTYAFDRLVSTCVGRPFGITDQVITTEFPSLLEDKYITREGFVESPNPSEPTYKHVSYHYFRLRLLQSEILQVLQFQQAQMVRAGGTNNRNPYMHTQLPSPFLSKYDSFRSWRIDVDRRLWEWKESAPQKQRTGVQFSTDFLELNYWQAIIMLYRQSLSVPAIFEGEFNTSEEVESPSAHTNELKEDEERVFLKVAEAGQRTLRLYRSLHRLKLVNYTFLATHHLFMAGISFLYAIWHSPIVRSRLTMDEVDFTILAATSVLGDLVEKCPPAEACRDAFDRMSKATVQMCMSTTGFGSSAQGLSAPKRKDSNDYFGAPSNAQFATSNARSKPNKGPSRPVPSFDTGFNDLFPSSPAPAAAQIVPPPKTSYAGNTATRQHVKNEYSNDKQYSVPRASMSSPVNYSISPIQGQSNLDNSSIDPSLLPSAQNNNNYQQQHRQSGGPISYPTSTSNPGSSTNQLTPENLYGQNYENFDFNAMDFMGGGTFAGDGMGGNVGGGNGGGGLDLGFGLGWEGADHDFSEGNQLDLFDGFFFGGNGGGGY